jgi:HSP20 family protein
METRLTKPEDQRFERVSERPSAPPRADIFENKDEYLVIADVPGADKESLAIHLDADRLTIQARVNGEVQGTTISREFRSADYERSFFLPDEIDRSKIAADLKNGVLWLHLPKSEAVKPRRIEVRAG